MNRIEWEKRTVRKMITLYCRHHLKQDPMPEEYAQLVDYACERLDHCKYGDNKNLCKNCAIHCYAPEKRQQIREVMRWVGPRMMFYDPKEALIHMLNGLLF